MGNVNVEAEGADREPILARRSSLFAWRPPAYRASVSLFLRESSRSASVLMLAALFLALAVLARRRERLRRYWEIPFGFFVFTLAGFWGRDDQSLAHLFVKDVLHETTNTNNPSLHRSWG